MQLISKKMSALVLGASLFGFSSMSQAASAVEYGLLAGLFAAPIATADGAIPANGCTNEDIQLSGEYEIKIMTELDEESGNVLKFRYQVLPQGVKGVGAVSGKTYHVVGASKLLYKANDVQNPTFPQTVNAVANFKIISEGDGPALSAKGYLKIVIAADGTTTAEVLRYDVTCGNE